jgi:Neisseria PilC beta-propeller domain
MKNSIIFSMLCVAGIGLISSAAGAVTSFSPAQMPVGTAPRPAVTSSFVGSGNEYQFFAWHLADKYKGNLDAYKLSSSGRVVGEPVWRASNKVVEGSAPVEILPGTLDQQTSRNIVTMKGAAKVPFNADNFKSTTSLGASTTEATNVINYLRGVRSMEKTAAIPTGIFRERGTVLGDIMHSSPVFVGAPGGGDGTASFSAFRNSNLNRSRRIYVGANDGMVHAFDAGTYDTATGKFPDAGTGKEVFAYIPSMLIPRLKALSSPSYTHQYYVDGGLASGDVFFSSDNKWHTVLVGTLGAGGKGMFGLDITTAENFDVMNEATAANKILWEITPASAGYGDMGDTFSEPVVVKMNNGKSAMVVGNGYNSASGKAVLYIIDPSNGQRIAAIPAGNSAASGLSSPGVLDIDNNGTIDFVYAGDIEGKLWRFDLTNKDASAWATAPVLEIGFGGNGQPIIGAPAILPHPQGGYMVNFATGAYLVEGDTPTGWDIDNGAVQNYAYGIWDGIDPTLPLQTQTITNKNYAYTPASGVATTVKVMTSSANPVNYADASTQKHRGWKAALPVGASVPSNGAYVANGRFTFAMSNPHSADTTAVGNWLMQLDYLTGGPTKIIYDLNEDLKYDDADRTSTTLDGTTIAIGLYLGDGIISQPTYSTLGPKLDKVLYTAYEPGSPPDPVPPSDPLNPGLRGGHFDFDSYITLGAGKQKHQHQYDDAFDATGVDMLHNNNVPEFDLDHPTNGALINTYNSASTTNRFFFVVVNGDLSNLATIRINKNIYTAPNFPNVINNLANRKTYRLADLQNLSIELPRDALEKYGLHPTVTGCVNGAGSVQAVPGQAANQMVGGTPGKEKAWRNGALTIQVVKSDAPAAAFRENVFGKPEKGYVLRNSHASSLLREYTIFWHASVACYQSASWTNKPPLNFGSGGSGGTIAGSTDPGNGNNPFVASIQCVQSPTPPKTFAEVAGATGYTICTTIYSNGEKIVTVTAVGSDGEAISSEGKTVQITPPGGGGGGGLDTGGDGTPGTLSKGADPPTPKGRTTGRVNWSEKIKTK